MGGSNSKKDKHNAQGVQMRDKKTKGNKKERPLSEPGGNIDIPTNFSMRPNPEGDISGRRPPLHYASMQDVSLASLGNESKPITRSAIEEEDQASPGGQPQLRAPTQEELTQYRRALDQVLLIWPQYDSIKAITTDVSSLDAAKLLTLKDILQRLYSQHHGIREAQRERDDLRRKLDDQNALQHENRNLKEDVHILKDELKRRGWGGGGGGPKGSAGDRRSYAMDTTDPNTNGLSPSDPQQHSPGASSSASNPGKMTTKLNSAIYQATPMAKAFGNREEMRQAVKRNPSMIKEMQGKFGGRPSVTKREDPQGRIDEEAHGRIVEGQSRRGEVEELKERIRQLEEEVEKKAAASTSNSGDPQVLSVEGVSDEYTSLENKAVGSVAPVLDRHLSQVKPPRRAMFICAVMETSYAVCKDTIAKLTDILTKLVQNPAAAVDRSFIDRLQVSNQMSSLAARTAVPHNILHQLLIYLQSNMHKLHIDPLIERITDDLRADYPDCVTPGILHQPTFRDFMDACCKVAWQMAIFNPPMYLSTEFYTRFDDRYHQTYDYGQDPTNLAVDYYRWPIMFSCKRGSVVHKGHVVLK